MSSDRKPAGAREVVRPDPDAVADAVALDLSVAIGHSAARGAKFHLALAGGSTPRRLYERLAREPFRSSIAWSAVHLFWGDERCVPPDHADSNFRMVKQSLLDHVTIPDEQIHRVRGEDDPASEMSRCEAELARVVPGAPWPRFDWVLLGVGDDGHTASLFPGQPLSPTGRLCGVARHPVTGAVRISFTRALIEAADQIALLVTGGTKASIMADIRQGRPEAAAYPAAQVAARGHGVTWYLDRAAAGETQVS